MSHDTPVKVLAPDSVAMGLDYLRISYDIDDTVKTARRYVEYRADQLGAATYGKGRYAVEQTKLGWGSGCRAGRHISVIQHNDRPRVVEVVSGVGARLWAPPRRQLDHVSIGRVDVAVDMIYLAESIDAAIYMADNIVSDLYDQYMYLHTSRVGSWGLRNLSLIRSTSGTTMYVGRRVSDKMLRVYNKSADLARQQIADARAIVRVELELKGRGVNLGDVDYILLGETFNYVHQVAAYIQRTYSIPVDHEQITYTPPYNPRLDEPDFVRSLRWIRSYVLPTLIRLHDSHPDELAALGITLDRDAVRPAANSGDDDGVSEDEQSEDEQQE